MLNISSIYDPSYNTTFDSAILYSIIAIFLLSLFSLCFVFHLLFKSQNSHHLQSFNSLWSVRFLLVFIITLWGLNELFRIPLFRKQHLYPFFPSLTLSQQESLCKVHVVLSLGLLEPGFLVILLFLMNISIKRKTPRGTWVHAFLWSACIPILTIQFVFVFTSMVKMPSIFHRSSVVFKNNFGVEIVMCTYPLISCILFGAFGVWYTLFFFLSCFKVVTLAINKGLRARIYSLAFVVMVMLPLEILFLVLSAFWRPEETIYGAFSFLVFFTTLVIAAVGEGIMIIRPIIDSLAAGGTTSLFPQKQEAGQRYLSVIIQS